MGRSSNSFISYVGHAEETMSDDRVTLPEKDLWVAVLCRAALDAFNRPPALNMKVKANRTHQNIYSFDRDQARHFFMDGGFHFNLYVKWLEEILNTFNKKQENYYLNKMVGM